MTSPSSWLTCAGLLALALTFPAAAADTPAPTKLRVYFGTYTGKNSKGIYRSELDLVTGRLTPAELAGEAVNPSFLAIHPSQKYLYAVGEVASSGGKKGGAVIAFAIDPQTGSLTRLNEQSSGGAGPCHISTDKAGRHVLVANYGGGSVEVLPTGDDGKLGEATAFVQHQGKGANPRRQEGPHAHSINLDAANRFAFAADLGLDRILVYRYDAARGTLTPNDPPAFELAPGAGPRHFAFHPSGKYAYVINEMSLTITAMAYDAEKGVLKQLQTISTLPKDTPAQGGYSTAEVVVHPSGKFVYGSNRGHDSITAFRVDPQTGELSFVENQGKDVKTPRNFAIDPTGTYLLAANQGSGSVVVFKIDPASGKLEPVGGPVPVPAPVCVRMMPVK